MEVQSLVFVILLTGILDVFTLDISNIPDSRTFELCSGSRLELKFDEVAYNPKAIVSWHVIFAGESEEKDVGLVRSTGIVLAVGNFTNRELKRVGDLGMALSDMRASDSGLYRVSQDVDYRYNITIKDPCLNTSVVDVQEDKKCVNISCQSRNPFKRIEVVEGDNTQTFTQNPYEFCSTSVVSVSCVVDRQGQEVSKTVSVDLKMETGLGPGEIIGIVIGCLAGLAVIGLVIYILVKRASNSSSGFHIS